MNLIFKFTLERYLYSKVYNFARERYIGTLLIKGDMVESFKEIGEYYL